MKYLGKLKKRKVESEYVRPITKIVCDKCGKELVDLYAEITTQHNLWGNDSWESIEYCDLCFNCAKKIFNQYLENPEATEQFEYECKNVCLGEEVEMDEKGEIYFDDRNHHCLEKDL